MAYLGSGRSNRTALTRYFNRTQRTVGNLLENHTNPGPAGQPPPSPLFKASSSVANLIASVSTWYPTKINTCLNEPWAKLTALPAQGFNEAVGYWGDMQMQAQHLLGMDVFANSLGITGPLAIASLDALALFSYAMGTPHAHHTHPPSLTPAGIIMMPAFGTMCIGGSWQTLINKRPALRSGDLGFSTCCGFPPAMSLFTGSSSVFIGGARAARTCDIVDHCHHTPPNNSPNSPLQNRLLKMRQYWDMAMRVMWLGGTTAVAIGAVYDGVTAVRESFKPGEEAAAMSSALAVASVAAAGQVASDLAAATLAATMGKDPATPFKPKGIMLGPGSTVKIGGFPMPPWEAFFGFFLKRLGKFGRQYADLKGRTYQNRIGGGGGTSSGAKARGKQQKKVNNAKNKKTNQNKKGPNKQNKAHNKGKRTKGGFRFRARYRKARMNFNRFANKVRHHAARAYRATVKAARSAYRTGVKGAKYMVRATRTVVAKSAKMATKAAKYAAKQTVNGAKWAANQAKNVTTKIGNFFSRNKNGANNPPKRKHKTKGCPISVITGEELLVLEDFQIRGALSFTFERMYRTGHDDNLGLGVGWTYTGCQRLETGADAWTLHHSDGRQLRFTPIDIGEASLNMREQATLTYVDRGLMRLEIDDQEWVLEPFASCWLVTHLVDRFQNFYHFERDAHGRWLGCHGDHGRGFRVAWNDQGLIAAFIPCGTWYHAAQHAGKAAQPPALMRYRYDDADNLVAAFDRVNACERYDYRNHLLTRRTLKTGFSFYFEWDRDDIYARCLSTWGDNGIYRFRFDWDLAQRRVTVTNVLGAREQYAWDEAGNLTMMQDGRGNTTLYSYDELGRLLMVVDALDRKTEFRYDDWGRLVETTDPLGGTTLLAYHANGRPDFLQDRAGNAWLTEYNDFGAPAAVWDPMLNVTTYDYDRYGNPTHITYADDSRITLFYNRAGDTIMVQHADGGTTCQEFDLEGNLTAQIWPDGGVTRYERDALGRVIRQTFPDGTHREMSWTAAGDLWRWRDGLGRETRYDYAGLRQPQSQTNPDGTMVHFHYDADRNLIGLDNEAGDSMVFHYDAAANLVERIGFDGRRHRFHYDAGNRLVRREEPGQVNLWYCYDGLDRLIETAAEDLRSGEKPANLYSYDNAGNLISAVNRERALFFRYDAVGNLIEEWQDDEPTYFHYDAVGQLIAKQLPDGRRLRIERDHDGAWTALHLDDTLLASVSRDRLGRERERCFGNGLVGCTEYNAAGHIAKQWVHGPVLKWDLISQRRFEYDAVGNLTSRDDAAQGVARFGYDACDFPIHVHLPAPLGGEQRPARDAAGNPHGSVRANRLLQWENQTYAYDARGNLIERGRGNTHVETTTFTYNGFDQLTACTTAGQTTTYAYDALGRRIRKRRADQETLFYWDRVTLMMEESDTEQRWFFHEPDSFIPLAAQVDDALYYYHVDHLGTPCEVSDQRGRLQWSAGYRTWGEARADRTRFDNPFRYQGQYYDTESGLHYNLNRYYDPSSGRFTSQDPIGLAGGLNAYAYAPNPTRWLDPFGFCKEQFDPTNSQLVKQYEAYKAKKGDKAMDAQTWYEKSQTLAENKQFYKDAKNYAKNHKNMPDHAKFTTAEYVKLTPELKHWIDHTGPRLAKKAGVDKPQIWVYDGVVDPKLADYAKGKVDIKIVGINGN